MKDETKQLLDQLNPLIEPLAAASKPGQTLVLSLTANLHRVPFHALYVDGELLICRNPIVCFSSAITLKMTEKARGLSDVTFKSSLFCDFPSKFGTKDYKALAASLSLNAHERVSLTSSNLVTAIRDPSLIL